MKIGEYPRMNVLDDTDVFIFSKPSEGTKSIRAEDLVTLLANKALTLISDELIEEVAEQAAETAASDILNRAYPVGSIYMSMSSTSPAELFGGTWEALKDRFLVGAGNTYAVDATGGAATVTLTVNQIPSHTHPGRDGGNFLGNNGESGAALRYDGSGYRLSSRTNATGGGQAHENRPPYRAVYMWKRTA